MVTFLKLDSLHDICSLQMRPLEDTAFEMRCLYEWVIESLTQSIHSKFIHQQNTAVFAQRSVAAHSFRFMPVIIAKTAINIHSL